MYKLTRRVVRAFDIRMDSAFVNFDLTTSEPYLDRPEYDYDVVMVVGFLRTLVKSMRVMQS